MVALVILLSILFIVIFLLWLVGERGHIILPSTKKVMKVLKSNKLFNLNSIHGYIYGRWTKEYISFAINYLLKSKKIGKKKKWSDSYHGKIITTDHAKKIIMLEENISLKNLETVIPYPFARDLILNTPLDIALYECSCRLARKNPCQPTQVCMVMGKIFVDFILEHHPKTSRPIDQKEALELIEAEHERGHIQTAWFKSAMLNRFYAICNCCKCCCGGIDAMVNHGIPMLSSSGYIAKVDESLCKACGICEKICPFMAIKINEIATINLDKCMGCGLCVDKCQFNAIALKREETKGYPLDIELISKEIKFTTNVFI